jgi:hypothetical protein
LAFGVINYRGTAKRLMEQGLNDVLDVQVSTKRIQARTNCSRDVAEVVKSILEGWLEGCTVTVKPKEGMEAAPNT